VGADGKAFTSSALERFAQELPPRPFCTDDVRRGVYREARTHAVERTYIAPNPSGWVGWIFFDIDRPDGASRWLDADLPAPNLVIVNLASSYDRDGKPNGGRAHLGYRLRGWIREGAGDRAERYLAAIRSAYTDALGADPYYTGHLIKNPLCGRYEVHIPRENPYDLNELAMYVDLHNGALHRPRHIAAGDSSSRNVTLFDRLRVWAYDTVGGWQREGDFDSWLEVVNVRARAIAAEIDSPKGPLPVNDIAHTAKSVAKWTWNVYAGRDPYSHEKRRSREKYRQTKREGLRARSKQTREEYCAQANHRRAQAHALRSKGFSFRTISKALTCSVGEVFRLIGEVARKVVQGSPAASDFQAPCSARGHVDEESLEDVVGFDPEGSRRVQAMSVLMGGFVGSVSGVLREGEVTPWNFETPLGYIQRRIREIAGIVRSRSP
jgi:hypothetical protein